MTQHISMSDLNRQLSKITKKDLILDVRGRDEYSTGHVPGSKNIPHPEISQHQSELQGYDQIFVYCQAGRRSQIATATLESLGFKNLICVSADGMGAWISSGYPVEK